MASNVNVEPVEQKPIGVQKPVLALGDVHGHLDRLEALLKQEGIIDRCPACKGTGDLHARAGGPTMVQTIMCNRCDGDGIARINTDVTVVQLGDLGHFGGSGGSPTGDLLCYRAAANRWIDIVLWGNHDRAAVDAGHAFSGYFPPTAETRHYMQILINEGRYKLAHAAHGFLLTHAGLHTAFRDNENVGVNVKENPEDFAEWINLVSGPDSLGDPNQMAVRDAIGSIRGGSSRHGGILWRDIREKLYMPFRQVFGHSADSTGMVRYCWEKNNSRYEKDVKTWKLAHNQDPSYCVDIGGKNEARLAGIWLPSEEIVRVDL